MSFQAKTTKKICAKDGMYGVQVQKTSEHQMMQALQAWRRQEEEGKVLRNSESI